jgi:hypothetical protein
MPGEPSFPEAGSPEIEQKLRQVRDAIRFNRFLEVADNIDSIVKMAAHVDPKYDGKTVQWIIDELINIRDRYVKTETPQDIKDYIEKAIPRLQQSHTMVSIIERLPGRVFQRA